MCYSPFYETYGFQIGLDPGLAVATGVYDMTIQWKRSSICAAIVLLVTLGQFPNLCAAIAGDMTYEVISKEIIDTPIKTQITELIVVHGEITEDALRDAVFFEFSQAWRETGFKYHNSYTNYFIYAYVSENETKNPANWIAMLSFTPNDQVPQISINDRKISNLGAAPQTKAGLSEGTRKRIFKEIILLERKADAEAYETYPYNVKKQAYYYFERKELYEGELSGKYSITADQLFDIGLEGVERSWPRP